MPSCAATCASSRPPMTSPMAYRCGSAVRIRASTCTKPFSTLARVDSRPTLSELGARPVATSICSARSSLGLLALLADHHAHAALVARHRRRVEARAGDHLDAAPAEGALELLGDLGDPRAARGAAGTRAASPRHRRRGRSWRTRRRPRRRRRRRCSWAARSPCVASSLVMIVLAVRLEAGQAT